MKLTVQPGDTLGRLTQLALKQAAPDAGGGRLPFPQLMQKVQAVAAQNQITNADRIFPGQVIDFSTVVAIPETQQTSLLATNATIVGHPFGDPQAAAAKNSAEGAAVVAPTASINQQPRPASPHKLLEQTLSRAVARGYIPPQDVSAVRGQILEMSRTYGFAPDDFARVALIESDGFNPKATNGNCHGVIQFCDGDDRGAASVGFGKNPREILRMSVREQLTLVDQYFQDTGLQNFKAPSLDTLYLTVLFPAARDERQPHRALPIPGPQASALHVGGNQNAPITRASIRKGLMEHANLRLAQFAKEETRERTKLAGQGVPLPPSPMSRAPAARETAQETGSEALAVAEAVAPAQFLTSASRVLQRPPSSITGMIPRMPELLPNFSVPSVSTQSVLNARRQS
jgi:hypothetical protein